MNTLLTIQTVEALEPYARRLVEEAERKGDRFERKWFLALQQARMVLRAYDAEDDEAMRRILGAVQAGELPGA